MTPHTRLAKEDFTDTTRFERTETYEEENMELPETKAFHRYDSF
jgi:hypothetical protein